MGDMRMLVDGGHSHGKQNLLFAHKKPGLIWWSRNETRHTLGTVNIALLQIERLAQL